MSTKLLLAFAAALSFALASCGGSGSAPVSEGGAGGGHTLAEHNAAVAAETTVRRNETRTQTLMTAARRNPTASSIAAAREANENYLQALHVLRARVENLEGWSDRQRYLASVARSIERARGYNTELSNLQARIGGGSGGSGNAPAEVDRGSNTGGSGTQEEFAAYDAAVVRHNQIAALFVTARDAADRNPTASSIAAARTAAVAWEGAIRAARLALDQLNAAYRRSGRTFSNAARDAALYAQFIENLQEWNTHLDNLQARIGGGSGGSGGSGSGGSGGSVVIDTNLGTRPVMGWIVNPPRGTFNDPHSPSGFPAYSVSTGNRSLPSFSYLQNLFDRYVVSSNRVRNLASDGYRSVGTENGIQLFVSTRGPRSSESFGADGGWSSRSGIRYWAQSPRGWSTGSYYQFVQNSWAAGQYSAVITDAHFTCRKGTTLTGSGWNWSGDYCEGNAFADAFGDRYNIRPATSGSWRGAMIGHSFASGATLAGDVTLRYSSSRNTVDVSMTRVRSIGTGATVGQYRYTGPSSFRWSSLSVSNTGRFEGTQTNSSGILGGFYGPEGQESTGSFYRRVQEDRERHCVNGACTSSHIDSAVVGAWLAKRQ